MAECVPLNAVAIAQRARDASYHLQSLSCDKRNAALEAIRILLQERKEEILAANQVDMENARVALAAGSLSASLIKRLDLSASEKFDSILEGLTCVQKLPDPTGQVTMATRLDDGLELYRVSCAVGVVCVIFEARPEVSVQISALALKSGNAAILKGGSEAARSNAVLGDIMRDALASVPGMPVDAIQLVSTRDQVHDLLSQDQYIDLIIPRGSNDLVRSIKNNTRIPVLGHASGLCSVYLDKTADAAKAAALVLDSKTNYAAACNAAETLLVHVDALDHVLPCVARSLLATGVELRADARALSCLLPLSQEASSKGSVMAATASDFDTEFLEFILAIKVVDSAEEAIAHINQHGSHHTDCIVSEDPAVVQHFMTRVDSAGVYHNASTRFADGFRYGFGAEVGVSTNKTHARGPMGLEGLVIYKYRLYGRGQVASQYSAVPLAGLEARHYQHEKLPLPPTGVAALQPFVTSQTAMPPASLSS